MTKAFATVQAFVLGLQDPCKNPLLRNKAVKRMCENDFLLSLVIAFFVVFICAQLLNLTYNGLADANQSLMRDHQKSIYMMQRG